ncbi:citrulline utilization hydrolase CtlX [Terrimonas rubra]|uniref:Citrulline utilization hydrolase CtlX n=1 Tax=Terrimonas rubra TaxID=1035890 RepID=A0ABW6A780_9BACT
MQNTAYLLMIKPVNFSFNAETAVNNAFQQANTDADTQERSLKEFNDFVALLRENSIDVTVVDDTPEPYTPDSIFPNNWISFHADGSIVLYPMFAANRRQERKQHVLDHIANKFTVKTKTDLSPYEKKGLFLEGTGSMVLDRDKKIAYACLSPRTDKTVLESFCQAKGYTPVSFTATDGKGRAIYHTNVLMCVADKYVVICLDAIPDAGERAAVEKTITETGKTIIPITLDQMNHFAGNMLQVKNEAGKQFLVMSSQAYESLTPNQVNSLHSFNAILHSPLYTIEKNGGGSARCMMAEIFLPTL